MKTHYLGTIRSARLERVLLELDDRGTELDKYNKAIDELNFDYAGKQFAEKHSIIAQHRLEELIAYMINLNKRVDNYLQSYVLLGKHSLECPHCEKTIRINVDGQGFPRLRR